MRIKPITAVVLATSAVLFLGGAAGCDKQLEQFNDADLVDSGNSQPAQGISMPDGFSNVATKCDHGNRIYVAFKGDSAYAAIAVVPDDKSCDGD